jgi:hypothetical protein
MGDKQERDAAIAKMETQYRDLNRQITEKTRADETVSDELAGQFAGSKRALAAARLARGESAEDVAADLKMGVQEVQRAGVSVRALEMASQQRKQQAYFRRAGKAYREEREALGITTARTGGIEQNLEDVAKTREQLQKAGVTGEDLNRAMRFIGKYRAGVAAGAEMTGLSATDREHHDEATEKFDEAMTDLSAMDTKSIKAGLAAGVFTAQGGADRAQRVVSRREALSAATRSRKKGAGLQTAAGMLGGELDAETAKQIASITDVTKQAAALEKALGITGKVDEGETRQFLAALRKGDVKAAEKEFRDIDTEAVRKGIDEKRIKRDDEAARMNDPTVRAIDGVRDVLKGGLKVAVVNISEIGKAAKEGDKPTPP